MSMNGHSFYKKDWLELAAMAAAGTAGAGLADAGPLAGLLGSSAPETAMGPVAGAFGMGDKGLGVAAEGLGGFTGGPEGLRTPGLLGQLGNVGKFGKAANAMRVAGLLQPPPAPGMPMPHGGGQQQIQNTQLYPQQAGQMPPEIAQKAALNPNDPLVLEWKKLNGQA